MKDKSHMYQHEVDEPKMPMHGHQESGMGMHSFKEAAADIAYGQAGREGCKSDMKKIESQMKHYSWEGASEY